jgi:hypothetical protein
MIKKFLRALKALYLYPYKSEIIDGINRKWFPVFIKYPVYPKPRYGYNGLKPHRLLYEIINRGRNKYKLQLMVMNQYADYLLKIKTTRADDLGKPYWSNPWFSGLDAIALYYFMANAKPDQYVEIGSGNSTKFAKQAVLDHKLPTKIISIDPLPREKIDSLSDKIIRAPLEETDLSLFSNLSKNDVLFFDGSHRCFMNSDVTVFFLDVLPRVPSGVLIHIHDIHLPYDYPPVRALHYESEQYLLATMLLGECAKYEVVLPNRFIVSDPSLMSCLNRLWDSKEACIPKEGLSFWIKKR